MVVPCAVFSEVVNVPRRVSGAAAAPGPGVSACPQAAATKAIAAIAYLTTLGRNIAAPRLQALCYGWEIQ
jgi:hypothetical protein